MSPRIEKCDVCVVGAGLAGLNALFAVTRYLTSGQRVILIDRRERVGGMWVDTYPYVRLHQPHPMFTAGNIRWDIAERPEYLASKAEVLDHFARCLAILEQQVRVEEYFGWSMESETESEGIVRLTCRHTDGAEVLIETPKLIKAYGFRVQPNDPLPLSSPWVHSVSPDSCDLREAPIAEDDAPVWIIGGGKTAMDTAHTLITAYPGREVNLVAGSGTLFINRDLFFPRGSQRWWSGCMFSSWSSQITQRYNGTNEDAMWEWTRVAHGLWATPQTGSFVLGLLSPAEQRTITEGLNTVVMDHLVDVTQTPQGTQMLLRSGARLPVRPGSWVLNCTGYITHRIYPYEPFLSPSGAVLSIQSRSATLTFSSYMAYFATHMMMSGAGREVPIYEMDMFDLYRKSHKAFPYATALLAQYNLGLYADHLPLKAFRECGLDFDRWYPLPRRLWATASFMRTHRRDRDQLRRTLDTVRDRFDVRCGPLASATSEAA